MLPLRFGILAEAISIKFHLISFSALLCEEQNRSNMPSSVFLEIKVGLSPSNFFIYFNDSPSKMMKNAFYFILKALFVLKIFKFWSWLFSHAEKQLD